MLSLKEALKNAGIRQSVKKTVYTREEVLAKMDELDAEVAKKRNLHNILEALDDAIVAVRAYVKHEKDESNKATILLSLDKKAKQVYTVLVKVLQAFVNRKGENNDTMFMRFGDYVAYGAVCAVTGLPKFDIKKNRDDKKTRIFVVTLRDVKQKLSAEMVEEVYLKSHRKDEDFWATVGLPTEAVEPHATPEEDIAKLVIEEPVDATVESVETESVPTEAPVETVDTTDTPEPTSTNEEENHG